MLMSRKSDAHKHLERRITKKHSGIHTVTPSGHHDEAHADAPKREPAFGEFKYDSEPAKAPSAYKSILGL